MNIHTDTRVGLVKFSAYVEAATQLVEVSLDTRTVGAQFATHQRHHR